MTRKEKNFLYKQFANKRTGGKDSSSIRKVIARANKKFHLKKEKKLSYSTVQRYAKKTFKKIKYKKIPKLSDEQKKNRKEFGDYIINNKIDYKNIFFTDEKQFELIYTPNKQNNQIRLTKLSKKKLEQGDEEIIKLTTEEKPKFTQKMMVAGGISFYGVGKLNFVIGTMDTCAYLQTLKNYKEDIEKIKEENEIELIFQQDGATCHTSTKSMEYINNNLNLIKYWPANSPDISPIEYIWSQLAQKLEAFKFKNLDDLKEKINYYWNRIPDEYLKNNYNHCFECVKQLHQFGVTKNIPQGPKKLIPLKKNGKYEDEITNIVYNEAKIQNTINRKIKILNKLLEKQNKIIKKLNTKKFKNSCSEKIKSKFFEQAYKMVYEEKEKIKENYENEIERLTNISTEEYFNNLNPEKKKKMINMSLGPEEDSDTTTITRIIENIINKNIQVVVKKIKKILKNSLKIRRFRKNL